MNVTPSLIEQIAAAAAAGLLWAVAARPLDRVAARIHAHDLRGFAPDDPLVDIAPRSIASGLASLPAPLEGLLVMATIGGGLQGGGWPGALFALAVCVLLLAAARIDKSSTLIPPWIPSAVLFVGLGVPLWAQMAGIPWPIGVVDSVAGLLLFGGILRAVAIIARLRGQPFGLADIALFDAVGACLGLNGLAPLVLAGTILLIAFPALRAPALHPELGSPDGSAFPAAPLLSISALIGLSLSWSPTEQMLEALVHAN